MEDFPRDTVQGSLLGQWLADLKAGRSLQPASQVAELSPAEVEEVARLAYWWAAHALEPRPLTIDVERLMSGVSGELARMVVEQEEVLGDLTANEPSLSSLLENALEELALVPEALDEYAGIRTGTLRSIIAGEMPAHRLPVDQMIRILQRLRLLAPRVVDLVRESSSEWVGRVFGSAGTAFGRVDGGIGERGRALADAIARDGDARDEEFREIDEFCRQLLTGISGR